MNIVILSEFDLIKTSCKHAIRGIHDISDVLAINPGALKSIIQERSVLSWKVTNPDIIMIDLDSRGCAQNVFQLALDLVEGKIVSEGKQPKIAFLASAPQYDYFLAKNGNYEANEESNRIPYIDCLFKPYTPKSLNSFVRNLIFSSI